MSAERDAERARNERAIRDLILDSSEAELRDALPGIFASLSARARAAAKRALTSTDMDKDQEIDRLRARVAELEAALRAAGRGSWLNRVLGGGDGSYKP